MSEVCVTYIQRVFCIVNDETGEIERVFAGDELDYDTTSRDGYIHDLKTTGLEPISPDSERGKKAVEIADRNDWPAWDFG
jgi:hypothetical protein